MVGIIQKMLVGISIYPVSYILTVIIKLLRSQNNIFAPMASGPTWIILLPLDSLLHRFGTGVAQLGTLSWCIIVVLLIALNAICFISICSIIPRKWNPAAIIILYIIFVAINSYKVDINF